MDKRILSGGVLAASVLSGAVLGAAAGLLLAPQPGERSREKLSRAYGEISAQIHAFVERAGTELPDLVSKTSSDIKEMPQEIKKELLKFKDDTFVKIEKVGKSVLDETRNSVLSSVEDGKKLLIQEKDKLIRPL